MTSLPLILDTDMSSDSDDAGDIKIAAALHRMGFVNLLGINVCTSNQNSPAVADAILTYMGLDDRAAIPIGALQGVALDPLSDWAGAYQYVYDNFPHSLGLAGTVPSSVAFYRTLLAAQPDHSVTIVTTGFNRSLQQLLQSPADGLSALTGTALVAAKVKLLAQAAGFYPSSGVADWNYSNDAAAGNYVVANWPTPIVFIGEEQGQGVILGSKMQSLLTASDPVREIYRLMAPNGRPGWGAVAYHFLLRRAFWRLVGGNNVVNAGTGTNILTIGNGNHMFARRMISNDSLVRALDPLLLASPDGIPTVPDFRKVPPRATATTAPAQVSDTQIFTANGTWTKPLGAKTVSVVCVGAGGSGGAGRRGAAGSARAGGSGGSAGGRSIDYFPASALGPTEPVLVGLGVNAPAGQTVDNTNGGVGGSPTGGSGSGGSAFGTGNRVVAAGGGGGSAGGIAAGATASGGTALFGGGASGAGQTVAGSFAVTIAGAPSGGGGGGGISTLDAIANGGNAGVLSATGAARGDGGVTPGGAGGNGSNAGGWLGTGGGGGASSITGPGGKGGDGAFPGAGGGGGGASVNGQVSGGGGKGGNGVVVVITTF